VKQGENFQILEKCFLKLYSYTIGYLQKDLKRLFQKICKNNLSGANVVQNVKLEESNHTHVESLSISLKLSNLCTSVIITNQLHFYTLYLLWFVMTSITKKGDIEREMGLKHFL
jgi:hypothetical protein